MSNPTNTQAMNAPTWNSLTTNQALALTGAPDLVTITGYFAIFSNIGANNVWISPDNVSQGIQVAPGETFETAISAGSPIYVTGTAAQPVSVVEFKS